LHYKADATQVKHAKYKPGQTCANCMLYQGKPTDASAACGIFPGKHVAGPGWCTAYVKRA
ncbi:MAG: high-potential iron-sulfur protein, partial [Burkholderiaceae bacterium]|nr:high-potential iron-sulfur protein [Burkholderiaceae bacterium]